MVSSLVIITLSAGMAIVIGAGIFSYMNITIPSGHLFPINRTEYIQIDVNKIQLQKGLSIELNDNLRVGINKFQAQKGNTIVNFNLTSKIAFVKPTFTGAAYNNAFYLFYAKYENVSEGVPVYNDLSRLTGKMSNRPANNPDLFDWILPLENHTSNLLPNSNTSVIEDQDIHNGKIFDSRGNNAYDVLVIGHEEYATQKMYENLKKFVYQGGVVMFMDGNIFYAEVSYNSENDTVTLVQGHSWEYNGIYAIRGVIERWFNETSSWVGSNYYVDGYYPLPKKPSTFKFQYQNDPFGYGSVRNEDQYVTNPDIDIILDYQLTDPKHKVVTYWKPYGSGKVIVLGIYSEKVMTKSSFLKFYDTLILEYALKKL